MEARLNYVLLGIFLVGTLFALVAFVFWLGKYDRNLSAYNAFYLYNKELPKGIRIETPVRYLGLPVGFVKDYGLSADKNSVEIVIWVKKDIILKHGAYASVESQGLTSGNFLALHQGDGNFYAPDERAVLGFEENWIEKVSTKAEAVFERLEVSLDKINLLLNTKNIENFNTTLANLKSASAKFDSTLMRLDSTFSELNNTNNLIQSSILRGDYNLRAMFLPLLTSLEKNSLNLENILGKAQDIADDFAQSPSGYLFGSQKQILGPRE